MLAVFIRDAGNLRVELCCPHLRCYELLHSEDLPSACKLNERQARGQDQFTTRPLFSRAHGLYRPLGRCEANTAFPVADVLDTCTP
jgi:hypothetical protein